MLDKIKIPTLKKVLKELNADDTSTQLVINTAKLYNDLIDKLANGEKVHPYMLTGTNGQVFNQLIVLKKLQQQKDKTKDDADPFTEFVSSFKGKGKVETR